MTVSLQCYFKTFSEDTIYVCDRKCDENGENDKEMTFF